MKNLKIVFGVLFGLAVLWPFSCTPQTPECDTVYVESDAWKNERNKFVQMINQLTAENQALALERDGLLAEAESLRAQNAAALKQIQTLTGERNQAVAERDAEQVLRISAEADRDQAIAGMDAAVAERNELQARLDECLNRPDVSVDTITIHTRWDNPADSTKLWLFAGGKEIRPHTVYFETRELCFIPVVFDSLTTDMRKYQTEFIVRRVRDHLNAETKYFNIPRDPAEYIPE